MSVVYLKPAWQAQGLSPPEKLVLLKLADQASDDGLCWPSIETIRKHTALGKGTIFRVLTRLEERGLIERLRGEEKIVARKANNYQIHLGAMESLTSPPQEGSQSGTCGKEDTAQRSQSGTHNGPRAGPQGSQSGTQNRKEPSEELKTRAGAAAVAEAPQPAGSAAAGEPRSAARGADPARAEPTEAPQAGSAEAAGREVAASPGGGAPGRKACDAWRAALPRLVGSLGAETVVAWLTSLIPERDDGQELRLLCPSELWRAVVGGWRAEMEAACGRRVRLGLQAEAGIPVTKDRKARSPERWRPPYAETAKRELSHLVEAGALPAKWRDPPAPERSWRGPEAWAAQRRAADVWSGGLETLAARLPAESFAWLVRAAAPWALEATGLGLVLPGRKAEQLRAQRAFFALKVKVDGALGAAWGAAVSAGPTFCQSVEEALAERSAMEGLAAARRRRLLPEACEQRGSGSGHD